MAEAGVPGGRLESVTDGVPEVEECALAALPLVGRDDAGLQPHRAFDQGRESGGIARRRAFQVALAPLEQLAALEQRAFHHLGEPAPDLALRKGREELRVANHEPRLVEGAHQVLSGAEVGSRLSAQPGIDLGQQRRRHAHPGHAAQVQRGRQTRQIGQYAPADGDDVPVPPHPSRREGLAHDVDLGERLAGLGYGSRDRVAELRAQGTQLVLLQQEEPGIAEESCGSGEPHA